VLLQKNVDPRREPLLVVEDSEMCSGSEAGSYFRPIDFVYHSTLGLRVIRKKHLVVEARSGNPDQCLNLAHKKQKKT